MWDCFVHVFLSLIASDHSGILNLYFGSRYLFYTILIVNIHVHLLSAVSFFIYYFYSLVFNFLVLAASYLTFIVGISLF